MKQKCKSCESTYLVKDLWKLSLEALSVLGRCVEMELVYQTKNKLGLFGRWKRQQDHVTAWACIASMRVLCFSVLSFWLAQADEQTDVPCKCEVPWRNFFKYTTDVCFDSSMKWLNFFLRPKIIITVTMHITLLVTTQEHCSTFSYIVSQMTSRWHSSIILPAEFLMVESVALRQLLHTPGFL